MFLMTRNAVLSPPCTLRPYDFRIATGEYLMDWMFAAIFLAFAVVTALAAVGFDRLGRKAARS